MSAYPDLPISQLPPASSLDGSELFATVQDGITKYTTAAGIFSGYQAQYTNYGAFYSTGSQTNPVTNVSRSMIVESTSLSNGVTVVDGSKMTVTNPGIYNLQFSAQLEKNSNGVSTTYIWLKKNGTNVSNTTTAIDMLKQAGGGGKVVAAWNFVESLNAGDYLELAWQASDTDVHIAYITGSSNYPAIPSIIATLTQVA